MAAREGQGLQIAVIIFALLSIVFAVTTYMGYASAQTAAKEREAAVAGKTQADARNSELDYQLKACQYVLGLGTTTQQNVMEAEGKVATKPAEITQMLGEFESDMAAIEPYKGEKAKNYRTMSGILLTAINKKNANVFDADDQIKKTQADKVAAEAREGARAKAAEDARDTATSSLNTEKTNYATSVQQMKTDIATVKTDVETNIKETAAKVEALEKNLSESNTRETEKDRTITGLKEKRKELESERETLFESPDGKIVFVNQRQRLVWINVGRADGLLRQTTFSVFDHDINGVTNAIPKARIEVVRVSDDHMAECNILEDSASKPIITGDVIHTPSWSPGQRVHFALAGKMNLDGDRIDDFKMVRDIITLNGGVIDAEVKPDGTREGALTADTRYLVLGEPPDDTSSANALAEFTKIRSEVTQYGTDMITVQKLLTQMGWKSEERTVELKGGGGSPQFRARRPGQKGDAAAPAGTAPAGQPMPSPAPEAPATVDPFAPGAEGAAPAPATADPFAVPAPAAAPKPAAAPEVADPFAPK